MESSSFLLKDEAGADKCVFTGDTLFIGDVGRPDLAQKAADMTSAQLAAMLYNSLRTKLMPLADAVVVYPAHGAGSSCGKALSAERSDTLGNQKLTNYALRADMTEAEFVAEVLDGQGNAPKYFAADVAKNKGVNNAFTTIIAASETKLTPDAVEALIAGGTMVIDSRGTEAFCAAHVPKTQFCGLQGNLALWAGKAFTDIAQPYAVIADDDAARFDTVARLTRTGFDNCVGHLAGGIEAWKAAGKPLSAIAQQAPATLAALIDAGAQLVDVRGGGENAACKLPTANHRPLCGGASTEVDKVDAAQPAYVYCAGGYRSVIFISNMVRHGYAGSLVNVTGGFGAMTQVADVEKKFVRAE
jgi:rhodanese-related sulfurtransferase